MRYLAGLLMGMIICGYSKSLEDIKTLEKYEVIHVNTLEKTFFLGCLTGYQASTWQDTVPKDMVIHCEIETFNHMEPIKNLYRRLK